MLPRGALPCLYTHFSVNTHTDPDACTFIGGGYFCRVNVAAAAADAGHSLHPSHYPCVLNDSINTSRWLFKAPNVPTSTMWFQQSNPCVDNLPWKIGWGQASNYCFAPCSQRLVSDSALISELFENRMNPTLLLLRVFLCVVSFHCPPLVFAFLFCLM